MTSLTPRPVWEERGLRVIKVRYHPVITHSAAISGKVLVTTLKRNFPVPPTRKGGTTEGVRRRKERLGVVEGPWNERQSSLQRRYGRKDDTTFVFPKNGLSHLTPPRMGRTPFGYLRLSHSIPLYEESTPLVYATTQLPPRPVVNSEEVLGALVGDPLLDVHQVIEHSPNVLQSRKFN